MIFDKIEAVQEQADEVSQELDELMESLIGDDYHDCYHDASQSLVVFYTKSMTPPPLKVWLRIRKKTGFSAVHMSCQDRPTGPEQGHYWLFKNELRRC